MTIYLDVLILKEMFVNYIIIYLTGKLTATKSTKKILASFFATLYTIICFVNPKCIRPVFRIICSLIVVCISLSPASLSDLIKKSICFYIVTFFVAGIFAYKKEWELQMIYLLVCTFSIAMLIKKCKEKLQLSNYFCFVDIPKMNLRVKALIDTGHFLKGHNGDEVIVVSPYVYSMIKNSGKETYIKYKTIEKEVADVRGINIEKVKIKYRKDNYELKSVIFIKSNTSFRNYDAIVSMRFLNLEKESKDENGNYIFN